MADTTISLTIQSNGALVDPTSVELEDSTDTFGVRRTDTQAVVVSSGTTMAQTSKGIYAHTFTEPAADLTYEYEFEVVYSGTTYNRNFTANAGNISNTLILPDVASYFSSQAEVMRLLGTVAVDLLSDDLSSGQQFIIWQEILGGATETIELYLHQFYTTAVLSGSSWVRRRATILAANLLSGRRGNPEYFTDRIERIYNELNDIRMNRLTLPNVPERSYMGPSVRNYEVETFRQYHPLRVEESQTMGERYVGMDSSYEYPYWF